MKRLNISKNIQKTLAVLCLSLSYTHIAQAQNNALPDPDAPIMAQGMAKEKSVVHTGTSHIPPINILPAAKAQSRGISYNENAHTHPTLKLTPDKSALVRIDKPAGSIIIGNPNHLNILAESSQTLVVIPKAPGASHFSVLDSQGNVIMQRNVIIASPKEKYIRIRRSCGGADADECQQISMFYCPGMCHEIIIDKPVKPTRSEAEPLENAGNTNTASAPSVAPIDPNTE